MTNEDDSGEDRLTKNEFAELIQHLSMQEILTIEYSVGNVWAKLFARKNVLFTCNLCVVEASCFKNLLDHINGRRHKMEMERVKQLYHPDYTYPKNDKTESTDPKNNENSASNIAVVVAGCKSKQEKVENNTSLKNKKNNMRNKNPNDINSEIAPTISPIQSKLKNSLETSTINNKQGGTNVEDRKNDEKLEASKEINKEQQKINKDNLKKFPNSVDVKNESLCKEIAMEDDKGKDKSDKVVGVGNSLNSEESEKNNPTSFEKKTPDTDSKINNECVFEKSKIVINPAALSLKRNCSVVKENEINHKEKIKYQTDKIIIPTVHKNKIRDEKKSAMYKPQSNSNDLPKFSVKSYSYKSDDNDVYGILGVEYVIKILRHKNDSSPRYECGLCELVLDGFAMQRHLEGYNHRLKFCEKHFPTAIRHYRQYMQSVPEHEQFKVMTPVLEKLAMAIEKHHGRNLPYECYERDFSMNRQEILAKAFSCRHASEQYGPTFTHVIGANEIDEYIKGRQNYVPPSTSRTAIFDSNLDSSRTRLEPLRNQSIKAIDRHFPTRDGNRYRHAGREVTNDLLNTNTENSYKTYMSAGLYNDFYPPPKFYDQSNSRNVVQQVDDKTYNLMVDDFLKGTLIRENRKRSASPTSKLISKRRKSLSPLRDNDIWQAYRHMADQELNNLDEKYKQYRKDIEKHPSYNEEWQKFWKRRKDELKLTGLDHRNYNYQPEWVKFIKIRIEELYKQEVENIMINCRERLCLPMTNTSLLDIKYHVRSPKFSNETSNLSHTSETKSARVLLQDSPTVTSGKVNAPQVVSVLRLMTALEDSLGSLGPKIIDLLSKALQVEKTSPTQVNSLILSNANYSLIETAKEKFKGILITGLYESSKEKVLKQVINDAEDLLKYSYQNRQFLSSQRPSDEFSMQRTQSCATLPKQSQIEGSLQLLTGSQNSTPSLTENLLTRLDKKELASKLAASLVAQGKTDFEPQQLQKIISVYNLIEKKKLVSSLSMKETESLNKKKLSDTLSDLLKSPSTSIQNKVSVPQQKLDDRFLTPNANIVQQTNFGKSNSISSAPKASFNSVSQNSSDNYLINSAYPQLTDNAYGIYSTRATQYSDGGTNYTGNQQIPYQQNTTYYNNDLYQNNNRIAQSWEINSNMEMNSNYNMSGPNNYNQRTNWRNF